MEKNGNQAEQKGKRTDKQNRKKEVETTEENRDKEAFCVINKFSHKGN